MSEQGESKGIRIVKRGTGNGTTSSQFTPIPSEVGSMEQDALLDLDRAIRDFDMRISEAMGFLFEAWESAEDPDAVLEFNLERQLPREFWLMLLYAAFGAGTLTDGDFRKRFRRRRSVQLSWGFYTAPDGTRNEEMLLVHLNTGGDDLLSTDFDAFFDEVFWQAIATRWLLRELRITSSDLRAVLAGMPES